MGPSGKLLPADIDVGEAASQARIQGLDEVTHKSACAIKRQSDSEDQEGAAEQVRWDFKVFATNRQAEHVVRFSVQPVEERLDDLPEAQSAAEEEEHESEQGQEQCLPKAFARLDQPLETGAANHLDRRAQTRPAPR
mgnify:CR=1 FL=1